MNSTNCLLSPFLVAILAGNLLSFAALANTPPTLNPLTNVTLTEDAGSQTVPLSGIGSGVAGEVQTLTLIAASSNPSLIPNPTLTYTNPNDTGSLTLTPVANGSGTATITVTVNDGQPSDNTVTRAFLVVVVAVNDLPMISAIANRAIAENTSTGPIAFTIADMETPASSLIVSGSSSNPTLVPATNIVFAGTGANRTVTITPALNQFGIATITLTVADSSGGTTSRAFNLTVNAVMANAEMRIALVGNEAKVSWTGTNAVLQHCGEIGGGWDDVLPQPTSPYYVSPSGTRFYRLRVR